MRRLPFQQMQDDNRERREAIRQQIDNARSEEQEQFRDATRAKRGAYDSLTSSDRKEFYEMNIFCRFAEVARLKPEAVQNEKPKKPDISCRIAGEHLFFELGRIVDEKVAKNFYDAFRAGGVSAATAYSPVEPLVRILKEKCANCTYHTGGSRVDLVLYYYEQPPDRMPLSECLHMRSVVIDAMIQTSQFSAVWIFDMYSNSILWQWERRSS
jgi:hypothetical protein